MTVPTRLSPTLIALAAAQCLALLVGAVIAGVGPEVWLLGVGFGLEFGIVGLLAAWAVLGPLSGHVRWPGSLGGTVVVSLTMASWFYLALQHDSQRAFLAIMAIAIQYGLAQLPLWWLRLTHGYQLRLTQDGSMNTGLGETQFTLRQLMIVTTVVAVLLGLVRAVGAFEGNALGSGSMRLAVIFALLGLFNTMLVWMSIAAALSRISPLIGGPTVLVMLALLTWLENLAIASVMGSSSARENWLLVAMNYTQYGWLLVSLLILRRAGYRLRPTIPDASG